MITEAQKKDAIALLVEFYRLIECRGPEGIPSGYIYAQVMDKLSLQAYTTMIDVLKERGLIYEQAHVLYAKRKSELSTSD